MTAHSSFGAKLSIQALVKPATNKKGINSNKQLVGRYNTLHKILIDGARSIDSSS